MRFVLSRKHFRMGACGCQPTPTFNFFSDRTDWYDYSPNSQFYINWPPGVRHVTLESRRRKLPLQLSPPAHSRMAYISKSVMTL